MSFPGDVNYQECVENTYGDLLRRRLKDRGWTMPTTDQILDEMRALIGGYPNEVAEILAQEAFEQGARAASLRLAVDYAKP